VQHEQQHEEQQGKQLLPSLPGRQQLLDALRTLYLPAGYPNTVTGQHSWFCIACLYGLRATLAVWFITSAEQAVWG
jgi:hypothetical protein